MDDKLVFSVQAQLDVNTAALAAGHAAVCCFVNDDLCKDVVEKLAEAGVKWVAQHPLHGSNLVPLAGLILVHWLMADQNNLKKQYDHS